MADFKRKEQSTAGVDVGEASQQGSPVAAQVPGGAPTNWSAWFTAKMPWNQRDAERNEAIERTAREEKDLVQSPVTAYGRPDQHVLDGDGEVKQRSTGGAIQREEDKGKFSWLTGQLTWGGGSEQHATEGDKRTTTIDSQKTTVGPTGKEKVAMTSKKVEVVDIKATAAAAKKELRAETALAKEEIKHAQNDPAAQKAAEERIAKLDAAITAVDAASDDGAELKRLCAQHRLVIEPKYKVVEHAEVTNKNKLEYSLWKGSFDSANDDIETKTDNAGAITTNTKGTSTSMNLSEGKLFEHATSHKEAKKNADGTSDTRTIEPTEKMSLEAGDGELRLSNATTTSSSKSGADGKSLESSSRTATSDKSIIAGEDGIGFKAGGGTKTVETQGENSTEKTVDGHIGITDKGVLGDASAGFKQSDGELEVQAKATADGAFLIEVLPPDEDSKLYRIVTTVRVGVGGGFGFGDKKEEDGTGPQSSVSASLKVGASMVYTHAMTYEQAQRYMAEADRAEAAKASEGNAEFPEFGMLAKLEAFAGGETSAHPLAALGSSSSVTSMAPGDSVQLALSANAEMKLALAPGGSAKGFGADGSVAEGKSRTVTVAKDKDGMVIVTVGFVHTAKLAGGLSAAPEGITAKVGGSQAKSDGDEYTFKLDPGLADYEACYALILGTWSRDDLKTLGDAEPIRGHVERKKTTQGHKDGRTAAIGGAGFMFNSGTSQQGSSEISKTPDGPEAKISGGQSQSASFAIADVNTVGVTHTDTATSTVDSKGNLSTDLQTANSETDISKTLSNAGKTIKGWFGFHEGGETKASDVIKGAFEKTPGERMKELLEKQYTRLSGYKLTEADMMLLVHRAEDQHKWMAACASWPALEPMEKQRGDLLTPNVDMAWERKQADEQQIERATKIAIAKSLADFMESSGESGMEAIVNVMRNWGATFNKASTADDIGLRYEWPASMAKHRATYEKAEKVLSQASKIAEELLQDPNGKAKWHELSDKLISDLDSVHAALVGTRDVHDERARVEMVNDVSKKKAALAAANSYFDRATVVKPITAGDSQKDATAAETPRASDVQALTQMFANERITTLLVDLAGLKMRERELFSEGYKTATSDFSKLDAHVTVRRLYDLYEIWVTMIKELRGQYALVNADPKSWQVSFGPSSKKHTASTEPYVEGMIDIGKTAGLADYDVPDFSDRLRSRFAYY
jgi:hypothetical protein